LIVVVRMVIRKPAKVEKTRD